MRLWAVIGGGALLLLSCSRSQPANPVASSGAAGVDYAATATLEEDLQTGFFQLKLHSGKPVEVFYELIDKDGTILVDAAYKVDGDVTTVPDHLPDVRQWTGETPELYTLHLQVDGRSTLHPICFRSITPTRKDTFLVNGHKVPFKGADFNPRGLSRPQVLAQLKNLQRANVNALNALTPLSRALMELCDSTGLYVFPQTDTLGKPNPQSQAVQHAYQDLDIRLLDLQEGAFSIRSHRQFTTLDNYRVRWWVERDGKRMGLLPKPRLHFCTEAGASEEFQLKLPKMNKPGEYRIFFEAATRRGTALLEKGTVLATAEILLKENPGSKPVQAQGPLTVTEGDTRLVLRGKNVEMVFDRAEGSVKSLKVGGKDLLTGLQPVFDTTARTQCTWNIQENAVALQTTYLLPEGSRKAVFTLSGDGTLQVDSPGTEFCLKTGSEPGFRYFGRSPDLLPCPPYKTIRTTGGEAGEHPETTWLKTDRLTLRGIGPFSFRLMGADILLTPEQAFTLN